jgi:hypothetical protein
MNRLSTFLVKPLFFRELSRSCLTKMVVSVPCLKISKSIGRLSDLIGTTNWKLYQAQKLNLQVNLNLAVLWDSKT